MRILLFTGKGGVGKSTVAAGTATLAAASGKRTLVLSTDAAHSLADAFGVTVGAEPEQVAPDLYVHQVDAQLRFEQSWAEIQGYLLRVLEVAGVDSVAAEELTVIPGAEEVLALLELRQHALSDDWDVIVVDCAPTAETLRLLALPEALGWYMTRVFPVERRMVRALKPVLSRAAGVPMPEDDVFAAVERLHAEIDQVRTLLTGRDASVRLVLTPEEVVLAEARRSYTTLSLFGYRVDGVVANRVFPAQRRRPVARRLGRRTGRASWSRSRTPSPMSRSGDRSTAPPNRSGSRRSRTSAGRCTATATRSPYRRGRGRSGSPGPAAARCSTSGCRSSTGQTSTSPGTATIWW